MIGSKRFLVLAMVGGGWQGACRCLIALPLRRTGNLRVVYQSWWIDWRGPKAELHAPCLYLPVQLTQIDPTSETELALAKYGSLQPRKELIVICFVADLTWQDDNRVG